MCIRDRASLKHGYDREEGRHQYEERLATMKVVKNWLELLHEGVREMTGGDNSGNGGGVIDRELLTELDESRTTLNLIDNTLEELDGWEEQTLADMSLPDGRPSTEAEDSGSVAEFDEDDDAEGDDDLSDDSDALDR